MNTQIIDVTDNSFEQDVLNHHVKVLVEFWAPWCPHCQRMAPIINEIANEYHPQMHFCRVNIDENTQITESMDISGTPTFIIFNNTNVIDEAVGELSKAELTQFIENQL